MMEKQQMTRGTETAGGAGLRHCEIRNGELVRYCGDATELAVPDYVTTSAADAFRGCRRLTDLALGRNVTSIHAGAFRDCVRLRRVAMPSGLREIGD